MDRIGTRHVTASEVERLLDYPSLIAALRAAFRDPPRAPDRLVLPLGADGSADRLLLMPAVWPGRLAIVKIVSVHASRPAGAGGAVRADLLAMDPATGDWLGRVDGHSLTVRRTAATSVLAATMLARADASRLAVIGAGAVAAALAEAYATQFPLADIAIWARRRDAAQALTDRLCRAGLPARAEPDRAAAIAGAHIVSAATLSTVPLVESRHVGPGTHVDIVGGFTPAMREADDVLIGRARVMADGPAALTEAGDLAGPIATGHLAAKDVTYLGDVLRRSPQRGVDDVTLFKSAGLALEDLAAADLLFARLRAADAGGA